VPIHVGDLSRRFLGETGHPQVLRLRGLVGRSPLIDGEVLRAGYADRVEVAPLASSQRVANVMRGNRSRDTKPEVAVRRLLHARGRRFRVNLRPLASLRRTADIVFTRQRVAVFIDGCYWHGCPDHYVASKTNCEYWNTKIATNVARDAETTTELQKAGWTVLRYWSHVRPEDVVDSILSRLRENLDRQAD